MAADAVCCSRLMEVRRCWAIHEVESELPRKLAIFRFLTERDSDELRPAIQIISTSSVFRSFTCFMTILIAGGHSCLLLCITAIGCDTDGPRTSSSGVGHSRRSSTVRSLAIADGVA